MIKKNRTIIIWASVLLCFLSILLMIPRQKRQRQVPVDDGSAGKTAMTEIGTEALSETTTKYREIGKELMEKETVTDSIKGQEEAISQLKDTETISGHEEVNSTSRQPRADSKGEQGQADIGSRRGETEMLPDSRQVSYETEQVDTGTNRRNQTTVVSQFDDTLLDDELQNLDVIYPENNRDHENELPMDLLDSAP